MIVYTCPKCGGDLQFSVITTYPPINVTECPSCGWREEKKDKIVRIPYKTSDVASQPSCEPLDEATYYRITETGQLYTVDDVYTKEEVISILTDIQLKIKKIALAEDDVLSYDPNSILSSLITRDACDAVIQQKIEELGLFGD